MTLQKFDPYINVDPGTMSPYQHGEVYVLADGAETDLDLGHYERFIDINLNRVCNVTTGQVYAEVIAKERSQDLIDKLTAEIDGASVDSVINHGLHEFLMDFTTLNSALGSQIEKDYRFYA